MAGDHEPEADEPQEQPRGDWEAREGFNNLKLSHWVEIALTIALVVVGVVQATIYFRQADIAQMQANIAAGQLNVTTATERPFVYPKAVWIERENTSGDEGLWYFITEWENSGNTQTVGLRIYPQCAFFSADFPPFGKPNPNSSLVYILGPHQSKRIGRNCVMTRGQFEAQAKGNFLFVGGWATYLDPFNPNYLHRTRFCEMYIGAKLPKPTGLPDQDSFEARRVIGTPLPCWETDCTDAECDAKDAEDEARRSARTPPQPPK